MVMDRARTLPATLFDRRPLADAARSAGWGAISLLAGAYFAFPAWKSPPVLCDEEAPPAVYQRCLAGPARAAFTVFAVCAIGLFLLAIIRSRRREGRTDLAAIAVQTSLALGASSIVILIVSGFSLDAFLVCGVALLGPGLLVPVLARGARLRHRVTSSLLTVAAAGFLWAESIAR